MSARLETREDGLYIDGRKVLKGWESFSGWYWFALEDTGSQDSIIDGRVVEGDTIFYGLVQGFEDEFGYFSQAEIESLGKYKVWQIKAQDLPHAGRRS